MPDNDNKSVSTWMAVLGWIVALLSLALNWSIYKDSQADKQRALGEEPAYTYNISTYDLKGMPPEITKLDNEIRHSFTVSHRSGRSIEGLTLQFKSPSTEITDVVITEGLQGTTKAISKDGKEVSIQPTTRPFELQHILAARLYNPLGSVRGESFRRSF